MFKKIKEQTTRVYGALPKELDYSPWVLVLLFIALVVRLSFVAGVDVWPVSDMADYDGRAVLFLEQGDFGASAYRAPVYLAFLALHYLLFGHLYWPVYITQVLLSVVTLYWLHQLVRLIFPEDRRVALLALLIAVSYSTFTLFAGALLSETLFMFLFVGGSYAFLKGARTPGERGVWKTMALGGVAIGLATLTRSITMPLALLLPLWLVWVKGKRHWKPALVFALAMALVILPWTVRNYLVMHAFVPVDTTGGLNLYIGNNPDSNGRFVPIGHHPIFDESIGEVALDKRLRDAATSWILQHPGNFLYLTGYRAVMFWLTPLDHVHEVYAQDYLFSRGEMALASSVQLILFALGFHGIYLILRGCWKNRERWQTFLPLIILYWGAVHSLFYVQVRYRLPAVPFMIGLAAWSMAYHLEKGTLWRPLALWGIVGLALFFKYWGYIGGI